MADPKTINIIISLHGSDSSQITPLGWHHEGDQMVGNNPSDPVFSPRITNMVNYNANILSYVPQNVKSANSNNIRYLLYNILTGNVVRDHYFSKETNLPKFGAEDPLIKAQRHPHNTRTRKDQLNHINEVMIRERHNISDYYKPLIAAANEAIKNNTDISSIVENTAFAQPVTPEMIAFDYHHKFNRELIDHRYSRYHRELRAYDVPSYNCPITPLEVAYLHSTKQVPDPGWDNRIKTEIYGVEPRESCKDLYTPHAGVYATIPVEHSEIIRKNVAIPAFTSTLGFLSDVSLSTEVSDYYVKARDNGTRGHELMVPEKNQRDELDGYLSISKRNNSDEQIKDYISINDYTNGVYIISDPIKNGYDALNRTNSFIETNPNIVALMHRTKEELRAAGQVLTDLQMEALVMPVIKYGIDHSKHRLHANCSLAFYVNQLISNGIKPNIWLLSCRNSADPLPYDLPINQWISRVRNGLERVLKSNYTEPFNNKYQQFLNEDKNRLNIMECFQRGIGEGSPDLEIIVKKIITEGGEEVTEDYIYEKIFKEFPFLQSLLDDCGDPAVGAPGVGDEDGAGGRASDVPEIPYNLIIEILNKLDLGTKERLGTIGLTIDHIKNYYTTRWSELWRSYRNKDRIISDIVRILESEDFELDHLRQYTVPTTAPVVAPPQEDHQYDIDLLTRIIREKNPSITDDEIKDALDRYIRKEAEIAPPAPPAPPAEPEPTYNPFLYGTRVDFSGGGGSISSAYEYIKNPNTNRWIKTTSKIGKNILKKYYYKKH